MALGAMWTDGLWDEAIWDNAIWNQSVASFVADPFTYFPAYNTARSATNVTSNTITLTNVVGTQNVTFSGDASLEWSKNGGGFTTGSTTAVTNDTFAIRLDASAEYSTSVTGTMTVGSGGNARAGTYSVITLPDPAANAGTGLQGRIGRNSSKSIQGNVNG